MVDVSQKELIDLFRKIIPKATENDRAIMLTVMGVSAEILKPTNLETKVRRTETQKLR